MFHSLWVPPPTRYVHSTEAVLEYLGDTRVGCRVSAGRARADEDRDVVGVPSSEGEEGRPGPP